MRQHTRRIDVETGLVKAARHFLLTLIAVFIIHVLVLLESPPVGHAWCTNGRKKRGSTTTTMMMITSEILIARRMTLSIDARLRARPRRMIHMTDLSLQEESNSNDDDDTTEEEEEEESSSEYSTDNMILSPSALDLNLFQRRRDRIQLKSLKQKWSRPPYNPLLDDPIDFVLALLQALQPPQPQPQSQTQTQTQTQQSQEDIVSNVNSNAVMCLLESSTPSWRDILWGSIGFRPTVPSLSQTLEEGFDPSGTTIKELNEQVAPILQKAMSKPTSQYAILLSSGSGVDEVVWHFPTDPIIDYEDGTCWIEARLRRLDNDELLVVTGWSLKRRRGRAVSSSSTTTTTKTPTPTSTENDSGGEEEEEEERKYSPWLLDGLDWQDFREEFRPGIGREEWERICG